MQKKTSLKEKLLLILFGMILTLVLLEIGLRLAGMMVLYLQDRHNHFTFNHNEYRILCLGESTTALGGEDSYPSQLEEMLNAQSHHIKFTVINKGIISTTTDYILTHVDENLDIYKPQMVIVMMGINDKAYLHNPYKALWWENIKWFFQDFRVYKLAYLLYEHITHRIKEIKTQQPAALPAPEGGNYQQIENFLKAAIVQRIAEAHQYMDASAQYQQKGQGPQAQHEDELAGQSVLEASLLCTQLAQRYRLQGLFQQAQTILEKAAILNSKYSGIYQEWGELYLAQEKSAQAVIAFQAALALDPNNSDSLLGLARAYHKERHDEAFLVYAKYLQINPQDYWGHVEFAQWLRENKHDGLAEEYLRRAIKIGPYFDQAYVDLGQVMDDEGQYLKEKGFYLKEILFRPQSPRLYQVLGQFYQRQGRGDLAQGYFQKEAQLKMAEYYPVTLVNFNLLVNKILTRPIKVVIMQYPLRDIDPLKDYLGQRNGVVYVENRQDFKEALAKEGYRFYFKDNFAYDFGHCTREGNKLIAQHLAEVISAIPKGL